MTDYFRRARDAAFDGLIAEVEGRIAPPALVLPESVNPRTQLQHEIAARNILLHQSMLTEEDALRKTWRNIAGGLRHLRDYFMDAAHGQTVVYAARQASMRNAMVIPGVFITPPELSEVPGDFPMRDPYDNARAMSSRMIDLIEQDIPESRANIRGLIRAVHAGPVNAAELDETPGVKQDATPVIDLPDDELDDFGRRFKQVARWVRMPSVEVQSVAGQLRVSLDMLEKSYVTACRDVRKDIAAMMPRSGRQVG